MDDGLTKAAVRNRQLYESIGGSTGIATLVECFYAGVMSDAQLAPFFRHASMDRLQRMQKEFFTAALDGPVDFSVVAIAHAHQGRGITLSDFQRFAWHLFEALSTFDLSDSERYEVVQRISKYVNEVTGAPAGT